MKKLFSTILLLLLAACTGPQASPVETVEAFLGHLRTGAHAQALGYLAGGADPLALAQLEDAHSDIFQQLAYADLAEVRVDGTQAQVALTITAVDFAAVMEGIMEEALYFVFADFPEEALTELVETMLYERMTYAYAPRLSQDITVALEQSGGQWRILADEAFANAISGGMLDFYERLGE